MSSLNTKFKGERLINANGSALSEDFAEVIDGKKGLKNYDLSGCTVGKLVSLYRMDVSGSLITDWVGKIEENILDYAVAKGCRISGIKATYSNADLTGSVLEGIQTVDNLFERTILDNATLIDVRTKPFPAARSRSYKNLTICNADGAEWDWSYIDATTLTLEGISGLSLKKLQNARNIKGLAIKKSSLSADVLVFLLEHGVSLDKETMKDVQADTWSAFKPTPSAQKSDPKEVESSFLKGIKITDTIINATTALWLLRKGAEIDKKTLARIETKDLAALEPKDHAFLRDQGAGSADTMGTVAFNGKDLSGINLSTFGGKKIILKNCWGTGIRLDSKIDTLVIENSSLIRADFSGADICTFKCSGSVLMACAGKGTKIRQVNIDGTNILFKNQLPDLGDQAGNPDITYNKRFGKAISAAVPANWLDEGDIEKLFSISSFYLASPRRGFASHHSITEDAFEDLHPYRFPLANNIEHLSGVTTIEGQKSAREHKNIIFYLMQQAMRGDKDFQVSEEKIGNFLFKTAKLEVCVLNKDYVRVLAMANMLASTAGKEYFRPTLTARATLSGDYGGRWASRKVPDKSMIGVPDTSPTPSRSDITHSLLDDKKPSQGFFIVSIRSLAEKPKLDPVDVYTSVVLGQSVDGLYGLQAKDLEKCVDYIDPVNKDDLEIQKLGPTALPIFVLESAAAIAQYALPNLPGIDGEPSEYAVDVIMVKGKGDVSPSVIPNDLVDRLNHIRALKAEAKPNVMQRAARMAMKKAMAMEFTEARFGYFWQEKDGQRYGIINFAEAGFDFTVVDEILSDPAKLQQLRQSLEQKGSIGEKTLEALTAFETWWNERVFEWYSQIEPVEMPETDNEEISLSEQELKDALANLGMKDDAEVNEIIKKHSEGSLKENDATYARLKELFRSSVKKAHPDAGGSDELASSITTAWAKIKSIFKKEEPAQPDPQAGPTIAAISASP